MQFKPILVLAALLATSAWAAPSYTVGGTGTSIAPDSNCWAWDRECVADFRSALGNPNYFGLGGVVQRTITTVTLGSVDAASLAGLNMFIGTWNSDADMSAGQINAIKAFFLSGGDRDCVKTPSLQRHQFRRVRRHIEHGSRYVALCRRSGSGAGDADSGVSG